MRKNFLFVLVSLLLVYSISTWVAAQQQDRKQSRGVPLPKFDPNDVPKPFFKNLFKEALVGERPANLGRSPKRGTPGGSNGGGESTSNFAWSKIISRTTIEDEVKAIKMAVDKDVTAPNDFAGRGYKLARKDFTIAAAMFAIVAEYDAEVRWKKEAPAVRDAFARAAANAKAGGNIQVYNEAKSRRGDLQDLVGGGSFQATGTSEREAAWDKVCHRSPLMQRLEMAQTKNLQPWLANDKEFTKNNDRVLHEAEIIAAIAEILVKENMEEADDEEYADFSIEMKKAALEIVEGVQLKDYNQARKAAGRIEKACSQCHENYRG